MSKPAVIIIASQDDIHARTVARRLDKDARTFILYSAFYPSRVRISHWPVVGAVRLELGGETLDAADVRGVWWRRPRRPQIAESVSDSRVQYFCQDEARMALHGWLQALGQRVINPVERESAANQKPYQLACAVQVGLRCPRTIVTNSPEEARSFLADHGEVIFKPLTSPSWQMAETRLFRPEYVDRLALLNLSPIILQERILADCDIRVTMVDDSTFAVAIEPTQKGAECDWRLDPGIRISPHMLPATVACQLQALRRMLGLRFGAADLRLQKGDDYVFLEINPSGQFLFAEIHGDQPISQAVAQALLGG